MNWLGYVAVFVLGYTAGRLHQLVMQSRELTKLADILNTSRRDLQRAVEANSSPLSKDRP